VKSQDHVVENIEALAREYGLCGCRPCQLMRANDALVRDLDRQRELYNSTLALMAKVREEKTELERRVRVLIDDKQIRAELDGA